MKQLALVIALILLVHTGVDAQSASDDRRTISVEGEASTYVEPDRAVLIIGVETDGKTVADAKSKNDSRIATLMDAVRAVGIEKTDIQTSNLNIQPVYDYKSDDRRLIKYVMRNQIRITIKNLDKVEDVINKGLSEGGNVFNGLQFYVEDPESIRDSLRVEATMNAKARASKVAGALGVSVGKPVTINVRSQGGATFVVRGSRASESMMSADASSTEVSSGNIKIQASVSIMFEIE